MYISPSTLAFPLLDSKPVVTRFDGGPITSNGGLLLLAKADRNLNLCGQLAEGVRDLRQQSKVRHPLIDLLRERIYATAMGYEDANDLDTLADDPALRIGCGRGLAPQERLASQPTFSRLENDLQKADVLEIAKRLAEIVIEQVPATTDHVVLDVDASEDPCHGQQEFEFFNGHYGNHCYLPLFLHITGDGDTQRLLGSLLRPGNAASETGLCALLERAISLTRARFPKIGITLRGDAGFGHAEEIHFCEDNSLDFVLGLSTNSRLKDRVARHEQAAEEKYCNEDGRYYADFTYQADTWDNPQRVIARIEVTEGRANTRYVVTSITDLTAEEVYEFYCLRGEQENRIKESKLDLNSGRTSCHSFLANQFRLLVHVAANILLTRIQDGLKRTRFANAQIGTIRLRLLKVGAQIKESTRTLWVHLSSSFLEQAVWHQLSRHLDTA